MKILAVADEECKALWDYFTPDKLEGVELIIGLRRFEPPLSGIPCHHGARAAFVRTRQP